MGTFPLTNAAECMDLRSGIAGVAMAMWRVVLLQSDGEGGIGLRV